MLTKKIVIFIIAAFAVAVTAGVLAITLGPKHDGDSELQHIAGGVTLIAEPAEVKLELENQIHLRLNVANSGNEPLLAWALDLGEDLYLVKAEPRELLYHKGGPHVHHEAEDEYENEHEDEEGHGNVLIYAIPIEPGDVFQLELTLRVLFDSEGKFDSNPELRLSYARGTKDAQTLAVSDLQRFRDTFVTFPFVGARIHITR